MTPRLIQEVIALFDLLTENLKHGSVNFQTSETWQKNVFHDILALSIKELCNFPFVFAPVGHVVALCRVRVGDSKHRHRRTGREHYFHV